MIHGDCQPANFLFHGQNVHFIDFSDCGLGYYLYDCVPTLSYLRHRPRFPNTIVWILQRVSKRASVAGGL